MTFPASSFHISQAKHLPDGHEQDGASVIEQHLLMAMSMLMCVCVCVWLHIICMKAMRINGVSMIKHDLPDLWWSEYDTTLLHDDQGYADVRGDLTLTASYLWLHGREYAGVHEKEHHLRDGHEYCFTRWLAFFITSLFPPIKGTRLQIFNCASPACWPRVGWREYERTTPANDLGYDIECERTTPAWCHEKMARTSKTNTPSKAMSRRFFY